MLENGIFVKAIIIIRVVVIVVVGIIYMHNKYALSRNKL